MSTKTFTTTRTETSAAALEAAIREIYADIIESEGPWRIIREGAKLAAEERGAGVLGTLSFSDGEELELELAFDALANAEMDAEIKEWLINANRAEDSEEAEAVAEKLSTDERDEIEREIAEMWIEDSVNNSGYDKYVAERAVDLRDELLDQAEAAADSVVDGIEDNIRINSDTGADWNWDAEEAVKLYEPGLKDEVHDETVKLVAARIEKELTKAA